MSIIKKIQVCKGWTVQTKPYESFRVDITLAATIETDDDVDEIYEELSDNIDKKLSKAIENVMH